MADKSMTAAPQPQSVPGDNKTKTTENASSLADHSSLFVRSALDMSWQLALVVIVPIVGGYMLDQHYHKTPLLTFCGLIVAAIGVFGVLTHVVSEANQQMRHDQERKQ